MVTMTVFTTHFWKKTWPERAMLLFAWVIFLMPSLARAEIPVVEVTQFRVERAADAIELSASLKFDLPPTVEDALLRGMPVFFIAEADVFQDRWYWTDKKVLSVQRHMRLVYQPLTRRWRLGFSSGFIASNGPGLALNQVFDSLDDALAAVRRISAWQIGWVSDLDASARHRVEFRFRLDVSQLPRPLQIGVLGQDDWTIAVQVNHRLQAGSLK